MDNEISVGKLEIYLRKASDCKVLRVSVEHINDIKKIEIECLLKKCDNSFDIIKHISKSDVELEIEIKSEIKCKISKKNYQE